MTPTPRARMLAEFIGTFALIFIGAGAAAILGDGVGLADVTGIAFADGLTVSARPSARLRAAAGALKGEAQPGQ
jgi:glycerol uptake facilitator-like aquaporin